MKLTNCFSRITAESFGWDGDEDENWDHTSEQDDEYLNRDWPDVSKPLKGGKLKWVEGGYWPSSGREYDTGPDWVSKLTDIISYRILSERNLEGEWNYTFTPNYYSYRFMVMRVINRKPKRGKKTETETEVIGTEDTLAEAQMVCENHFKEWFGD